MDQVQSFKLPNRKHFHEYRLSISPEAWDLPPDDFIKLLAFELDNVKDRIYADYELEEE